MWCHCTREKFMPCFVIDFYLLGEVNVMIWLTNRIIGSIRWQRKGLGGTTADAKFSCPTSNSMHFFLIFASGTIILILWMYPSNLSRGSFAFQNVVFSSIPRRLRHSPGLWFSPEIWGCWCPDICWWIFEGILYILHCLLPQSRSYPTCESFDK